MRVKRQLPDVAAIRVHDVDLVVAGERDLVADGRRLQDGLSARNCKQRSQSEARESGSDFHRERALESQHLGLRSCEERPNPDNTTGHAIDAGGDARRF